MIGIDVYLLSMVLDYDIYIYNFFLCTPSYLTLLVAKSQCIINNHQMYDEEKSIICKKFYELSIYFLTKKQVKLK